MAKFVIKQGVRLLSTNAETGTVLVEAETAAVRVELNALVALGRATVDAAGNYLISVGDLAIGRRAAEKVMWVDEDASMSPLARDYDDGATGSRSNIETQKGQAPALTRTSSDGRTAMVRFDGLDGDVLVDRKISVVTTQKVKDQVIRQSEALQQNGLTGRWEVPTQSQADRATKMFQELGVTNIIVKVVMK